jgi:hypothetical protein
MNQRVSDAWGAMWSVVGWARKWQISETQAHNLRKHPKFPPDATVVIGARCVRFRAERLEEFAAILAMESKAIAYPERLTRGKQKAAAARRERDTAATWIAPAAPVTAQAAKAEATAT